MDCAASRLSAANSAYPQIWDDFLQNKGAHALQKASAWLRVLEEVPEEFKDADAWATEADFFYIAGAVQNNCELLLENALQAYHRCLTCPTTMGATPNINATRMQAETLLRLQRYEDAFNTFAQLASLRSSSEAEAPPFRLRHDAQLLDRLARLGRVNEEVAKKAADSLRAVALRLTQNLRPGERPRSKDLSHQDQAILAAAAFDSLWQLGPYPAERLQAWTGGSCAAEKQASLQESAAKVAKIEAEMDKSKSASVLGDGVDWERARREYSDTGVTIIDDFLAPAALDELWNYALESPSFRTVRYGFLGAFPADGFVHPIVIQLAHALETKFPHAFRGHPLGLWWLFKYTDEAPRGIGIHADAAAVNVNIWLTPDEARKSGGGLDIFTQVPPEEAAVPDFNREFSSRVEEAAFRAKLEVGGVRHVEYRRNRAAIFVSDLYHVSEPFDFPDSIHAPRVNLTLLFGDRAAARRGRTSGGEAGNGSTSVVSACGKEDVGWDLFD